MDDRAVVLMSGSELLSAYDVLHEEVCERQARQAQIVARLDEMGHAKEIGAHDTARLLSKRYRLDAAEAHRRVRFATQLHKYPAVAAALPVPGAVLATDGVVLHLDQAEAIVAALEKIPAKANVPVEDLSEAELRMVEAAEHLPPAGLRKLGAQVRDVLDTDGPEPREEAARRREEVWVKRADGGIKFGGYLAGENAERLETVLQSGAKPHKTEQGERDPRSRGKRQADALSDALSIALGSGALPGHGGIKPHLTVTIDLKDLIEAGQNATGDLTFGDGLSASAVRRLACDAGIIPVILGSDSDLLDVGREHRFVTTGLRNALNLRDRGCVVCNAPPLYCDAHHLTSWLDGGTTSLTNLVLLCRVHHTALHNGHWTITIHNNQVHVSRPTWATRPPARHRSPAPPTTPASAHAATTATAPRPKPGATPATPGATSEAPGDTPATSEATSATLGGTPTTPEATPAMPGATSATLGGTPTTPEATPAMPGATPAALDENTATSEGIPAALGETVEVPADTTAADGHTVAAETFGALLGHAGAAVGDTTAIAEAANVTTDVASAMDGGAAAAVEDTSAIAEGINSADAGTGVTSKGATAVDESAGSEVDGTSAMGKGTTVTGEGTNAPSSVARVWPFTGDTSWITPEETAALNPWGDDPETTGHPPLKPQQAPQFDPWADSA
ncbi:DUF222 domain-containing protein [Kribbella sp. CA-293567]|uniref:DUF222 domain-containing protein n=1 Tax=Kribbella sp. CA-293567 TaxID=3002436 RepID=UPI0022DD6B1D|nr:DUF222 domain-containing protein [Kribbella sp. CA-293567]WBQ05352.1 DUF222 domain-containing protein [Kribbella sp. CA-293567]